MATYIGTTPQGFKVILNPDQITVFTPNYSAGLTVKNNSKIQFVTGGINYTITFPDYFYTQSGVVTGAGTITDNGNSRDFAMNIQKISKGESIFKNVWFWIIIFAIIVIALVLLYMYFDKKRKRQMIL